MATTVRQLINTVKLTLQEERNTDGIRWTNSELIDYLNDAYKFVAENEPEAFAENSEFECVNGSRQELPPNAVTLINIVRNIDGRRRAINPIDGETLNAVRPDWQDENATKEQELFIYDDWNPKVFYVYPPALEGSMLEIVVSINTPKHTTRHYDDGETTLALDDRFYPPIMNYILHRSFDKDADNQNNMSRAMQYLQTAYSAMGQKLQNTARTSPNAEN